jgi:hypothetical protein
LPEPDAIVWVVDDDVSVREGEDGGDGDRNHVSRVFRNDLPGISPLRHAIGNVHENRENRDWRHISDHFSGISSLSPSFRLSSYAARRATALSTIQG